MTVIIAIKCTDEIAVTCDSRTSDPATGVGKDDAQKLHVIQLADGNSAIIGEAGNESLSARVLEIVKTKAASVKLSDYRGVTDLVQSAITEVKNNLREQYKGSAEELQRHFIDFDFSLIIAHYFANKSEIFTVDFSLGIATQQRRKAVSIGCGAILADFLLAPIAVDEFDKSAGLCTGIFIVEEIKNTTFDAADSLEMLLSWIEMD